MQNLRAGIYQFTIPYLSHTLHISGDGFHQVRTVDVEIHVGRKEDLEDGKIATIITYSTDCYSDYVAEIFTNIRRLFFQYIFPPLQTRSFQEEQIRYVEVHAKSQDINDWNELELHWDEKKLVYTHPAWNSISHDAWYFQDYQSKIQYYAKSGLQFFEDEKDREGYHEEFTWERGPKRLSTNAPQWLLTALYEAESYVSQQQLHIDSYSLLANSLKKLAGLEINRLAYTPVVTKIVISQIHKLQKPNMKNHYIVPFHPSMITSS